MKTFGWKKQAQELEKTMVAASNAMDLAAEEIIKIREEKLELQDLVRSLERELDEAHEELEKLREEAEELKRKLFKHHFGLEAKDLLPASAEIPVP